MCYNPPRLYDWQIFTHQDSLSCIEGKIADIKYNRKKQEYYLYFGAAFPHYHAKVVVPKHVYRNAYKPYLRNLKYKNVVICGKSIATSGVPLIYISSLYDIYLDNINFGVHVDEKIVEFERFNSTYTY